ncbi:MAG: hypothetical protein ACOVO2_11330 [Emticicia sp.]|uniref:hypothetical protein n=1 Tax=Emticicia sp. TaxID=1930953 RepID=UPI003BA70210
MNDKLIWAKIEDQLDKKTKIRVLIWRRIATAACLILLLGGSFWLNNKNKIQGNSSIETPPIEVSSVPLLSKEDFQKITKATDSEQAIYNRYKKKTVKEERLQLNVQQIENHKNFSIETPEVVFKAIELPQISKKMATTKMRVMHISEYQAQTSEVFMKPKIFYVQTDIQNIIKNQTLVIPYALANISN